MSVGECDGAGGGRVLYRCGEKERLERRAIGEMPPVVGR